MVHVSFATLQSRLGGENPPFPPLAKGSCEKFGICPLTLHSPARGEGKHIEMRRKFPPP